MDFNFFGFSRSTAVCTLLFATLVLPTGLLAQSAPTITTQPQNQLNAPGATARFTVVSTGASPEYQWSHNGTNLADGARISGATGATLTISNLALADAGNYQVIVSNRHGVAVSSNAVLQVQRVVGWGYNNYGQSTIPSITSNAVALSAWHNSVTLKADGTVFAWGSPYPEPGLTNVPPSLNNVVSISSGPWGTFALKSNGAVAYWGEVGIPAPPNDLSNVVAIAAGGMSNTNIALRNDGTVVEWSSSGKVTNTLSSSLSNVVSIAAGDDHFLALKGDGSIAAWGRSAEGQTTVPPGLNDVVSVGGGNHYSMALKKNGDLVGWGENTYSVITGAQSVHGVAAIACAPIHVVALLTNGTMTAWGNNSWGQLAVPPVTNVMAVAGDYQHGLAIIGERYQPEIFQQPLDADALANGTVLLKASAIGSIPLTYQWQLNGTNVAGATSSTLLLTNIAPSQAGSYSLRVTNFAGASQSSTANVSVVPARFLTQPQSLTVTARSNATFSASVQSLAGAGYQWYFNDVPVADATSDTLALSNVDAAHAGNYRLVVSNQFGSVTSAVAALTVNMPPAIPGQPVGQTVVAGGTALFSISATGTEPLYYRWTWNGAPLSDSARIQGAGTTTLSISPVQLSDAGNYRVQVTNEFGSTWSGAVVLAVTVPPTFSSHPQSAIVAVTSNITLSASASGTLPINFQWFFNGAPIAEFQGSTNALLTITNSQVSHSGSYMVVASNVAGVATSSVATVSVLVPPAITQQPSNQVGVAGSNVTFTVTASGSEPLQYSWFFNGSPLANSPRVSGANTATVSISNLQMADAGNYHVVVTNEIGLATSTTAALTVLGAPVFTTQPQSTNAPVGGAVSLYASASGTAPIHFQWFFEEGPVVDGPRIVGATNDALSISNAQSGDSGRYFLVASNAAGVSTSSVAEVLVLIPPAITQEPSNQTVVVGSTIELTVVAEGGEPLTYQWFKDGGEVTNSATISGAEESSLTISNAQLIDAGTYSVIVANPIGSTSSVGAVVSVLLPPTILVQPAGRSVPAGLPTTFSATASGSAPLRYQWLLNGTEIPSATNSTYTIAAVETNDLGVYSLVVTNTAGSVLTAEAKLTFGSVAAWGKNVSGESLPPPDLTNVFALAATPGASFAARPDGTVATWGSGSVTNVPASATNVVGISSYGGTVVLRADGTIVGWGFPSATPTLSNVVAVAAGYSFGVALRAEGTVHGWGSYAVPSGLNHIVDVDAGYSHAVALRSDGTILAWGTGSPTNVPPGLTNVVDVEAGPFHNLALKRDGTVLAWGTGSATNLPAGLTNIASIYAGGSGQSAASLAIRSNGTIVAWASSGAGATNLPSALTNLISLTAALTFDHGLALVDDGRPVLLRPPVGRTAYIGNDVTLKGEATGAKPLTYQWSFNGSNISGATAPTLTLSNLQLTNAGDYQLTVSNHVGVVTSLPARLNVLNNSTLTFLSHPTHQTNYQGGTIMLGASVVGNGPVSYQWYYSPTNSAYPYPAPVFVAIASATNDSLVLDPALATHTGAYYLRASNKSGYSSSSTVNVRVHYARSWGYGAITNPPIHMTNAVALAIGNGSSYYQNSYCYYYGLGSDGKVRAWANYYPYYGETNVSALSNSFVTAIAAGNLHSMALRSDGTVHSWGYSNYGQTNVPVGLKGVTAIACGPDHQLALKSDGTVIAWGRNSYGQGTSSLNPTNAAVAIAAGSEHNLALRPNGTVYTWGFYAPVVSQALSNVIAVAAGAYHSLALRADGSVFMWGSGGGTIPATATNVVAISASGNRSVALRADGTVITWGPNSGTSSLVPADAANVIAISSSGDRDFALLGTRAPAFTIHPYSRMISVGTAKALVVGKVAGVQPMSYQWRFNGTNIAGATNDILTLTNVEFSRAGAYQLVASNAYGVAVSKPAKIQVTIPLATALDATNLVWSSTGGAQWFGQSTTTSDQVDAAQSGSIAHNEETILQTTLATNRSGVYSFRWKVSSELIFDVLEFSINGVVKTNISGEVNWQQVSVPIVAGPNMSTNILQWRYSKDESFSSGQDAAWVDQFAFHPAPIITGQPGPVNRTVNAGTNINYAASVNLGGFPPTTYRWYQNGTNVVGGNSPTLLLNNVGRAQRGSYFLTVSNAGGVATSQTVNLNVVVPQLLSGPRILSDGTVLLTALDANGALHTAADASKFTAKASTNLVDWFVLSNALILTNGTLELREPAVGEAPHRFYRIEEAP